MNVKDINTVVCKEKVVADVEDIGNGQTILFKKDKCYSVYTEDGDELYATNEYGQKNLIYLEGDIELEEFFETYFENIEK